MQTTEQDKNKLEEGTAVQETQQANRTRSRKALSKGERARKTTTEQYLIIESEKTM